jgi:ribose transport system permease protein
MNNELRRVMARYSPLVIFALLCIALALLSPEFRGGGNLKNVAYRSCSVGLMAVGQTLVILVAGIDLSVGSVAALSGVLSAKLMAEYDAPLAVAMLAGVGAGLVCNLISGLLWTKGKIPPFIATLGMMMVARGAAHLLTGSVSIMGLPESFFYLGGRKGWWIPVIITVGITVFIAVMLTFTRFGRSVYATGGNATGARLSGVPVDRVRLGAFAIHGILVGFAGVMLASFVGIGDPSMGEGMELDVIAACVIGGASLMGGEGGSLGSLAGALIMNVLVNFCNLKGLDPQWQKVLVGSLIILLLLYDSWRKRRAGLVKTE